MSSPFFTDSTEVGPQTRPLLVAATVNVGSTDYPLAGFGGKEVSVIVEVATGATVNGTLDVSIVELANADAGALDKGSPKSIASITGAGVVEFATLDAVASGAVKVTVTATTGSIDGVTVVVTSTIGGSASEVTLAALLAQVNGLTATPTAYSLSDWLKQLRDRVGDAVASPATDTVLDRLKTIGTALVDVATETTLDLVRSQTLEIRDRIGSLTSPAAGSTNQLLTSVLSGLGVKQGTKAAPTDAWPFVIADSAGTYLGTDTDPLAVYLRGRRIAIHDGVAVSSSGSVTVKGINWREATLTFQVQGPSGGSPQLQYKIEPVFPETEVPEQLAEVGPALVSNNDRGSIKTNMVASRDVKVTWTFTGTGQFDAVYAFLFESDTAVELEKSCVKIDDNSTITGTSNTGHSLPGPVVHLVVDVRDAPTGTAPELYYTLTQFFPGAPSPSYGQSKTLGPITAPGKYELTYPLLRHGSVQVSRTVGGTSPSFTGVYAFLACPPNAHPVLYDEGGEEVIGRVTASPAADTLLDRVKKVHDRIGDTAAPGAGSVNDRLATLNAKDFATDAVLQAVRDRIGDLTTPAAGSVNERLSLLTTFAQWAARFGEVQATPTANTLLGRAKDIYDRLHDLFVSGFNNQISAGNSTSTPLGVSATFTGTWEDVSKYAEATVTVHADVASAIDGLILEQSADGGTTVIDDDRITFPAGSTSPFTKRLIGTHFRVRYINGASAQTTFKITTKYHVVRAKPSSHVLSSIIKDFHDAELVIATMRGRTPSGDFVPASSTADGRLQFTAALVAPVNTVEVALTIVENDLDGGETITSTYNITDGKKVTLQRYEASAEATNNGVRVSVYHRANGNPANDVLISRFWISKDGVGGSRDLSDEFVGDDTGGADQIVLELYSVAGNSNNIPAFARLVGFEEV